MLLLKGFQVLTKSGRGEEAGLLYNKVIIRSLRSQPDYRTKVTNVLNLLPGAQAYALQKQWVRRLSAIVDKKCSSPYFRRGLQPFNHLIGTDVSFGWHVHCVDVHICC